MRKRQLQILGVALLIAAGVWAFRFAGNTSMDEARYRQWGRPVASYARLVFLERHLPTSLSKALRLPVLEQRYLDREERIYKVLYASGYLTNVPIAMTNAGASRTQIADRLRKATQGPPPR